MAGIDSAIQGIAAIGGAIANGIQMRKARKELQRASKEQQANIDASMDKEKRIESENPLQLASTRRMLSAIDDRYKNRNRQNRNLAAMGMMDEGTAEQINQNTDTADIASQALLQGQNRSDNAVKSQEALMGQKNAVIQSEAEGVSKIHQAQAQAIQNAASQIGQSTGKMLNK